MGHGRSNVDISDVTSLNDAAHRIRPSDNFQLSVFPSLLSCDICKARLRLLETILTVPVPGEYCECSASIACNHDKKFPARAGHELCRLCLSALAVHSLSLANTINQLEAKGFVRSRFMNETVELSAFIASLLTALVKISVCPPRI